MQRKTLARNGWVPNQHGAWALVLVPAISGLVLALRHSCFATWIIPLTLMWLPGWFAFNAATLWAKLPRNRRPQIYPALATWLGISATFGLLALILGAGKLFWWILVFFPLLSMALYLTWHKMERSWQSGLATTLAASAVVAVPLLPITTFQNFDKTILNLAFTSWLVLFLFFFGTVIHVKSLIRERRSDFWLKANLSWHLGCSAVMVVFAVGYRGIASQPWWLWALFFLVLAARSGYCGCYRATDKALSPKAIGMLEAGFYLTALLILVTV